MTAYKKHLVRTGNKELLNVVSLWSDIEKYCSVDGSDDQSWKKKDEMVALILRWVLLSQADIDLNESFITIWSFADFTYRVSPEDKAIGNPSVRPSVLSFVFFRTDLFLKFSFLCLFIARPGLKVRVIGQGQRSKVKVQRIWAW